MDTGGSTLKMIERLNRLHERELLLRARKQAKNLHNTAGKINSKIEQRVLVNAATKIN